RASVRYCWWTGESENAPKTIDSSTYPLHGMQCAQSATAGTHTLSRAFAQREAALISRGRPRLVALDRQGAMLDMLDAGGQLRAGDDGCRGRACCVDGSRPGVTRAVSPSTRRSRN